ncbi:MAG: ferritin [Paraprevotella sp.]|nr:ferritin [Paraprevotella sp.]
MITDKLQKAINDQIAAEVWSANLYLSMSFYLQKEGYDGFASWAKKQSQEEMEHACAMADYMIKRGGVARLDKIDVVPQEWTGVLRVFENIYEHECKVSKMIDHLVNLAAADDDKASQDFFWGFVREQVEEEATAQDIVEKIKKAGEAGILYLNDKMGLRK